MRGRRRARIVAGDRHLRGPAILVRLVGLEPTRIAPPAPQAGVSTNSTTAAFKKSQVLPRAPSLLRRLSRLSVVVRIVSRSLRRLDRLVGRRLLLRRRRRRQRLLRLGLRSRDAIDHALRRFG